MSTRPPPPPVSKKDVASMRPEDLFRDLDSSPDAGLPDQEATRRLAQYGPNALQETRVNPVLKFLGYFWGPIPWMIEVAAVLSAVVRHWTDLVIIGLIWAYSITWSLLTDWAKLGVYHHLEHSSPRHRGFLRRLQQPIGPHHRAVG
jgi:magnesium-transporting ATPase (P-type)